MPESMCAEIPMLRRLKFSSVEEKWRERIEEVGLMSCFCERYVVVRRRSGLAAAAACSLGARRRRDAVAIFLWLFWKSNENA